MVATKLQAFTKDATAIPWLLLRAVDSVSVNNKAAYIQRLCAEGSLAPTTVVEEKRLGQQVRIL